MKDTHACPEQSEPQTPEWPEPEWTPAQALLALAGWQDARAGVPFERWGNKFWQQGHLLWSMKAGHLTH